MKIFGEIEENTIHQMEMIDEDERVQKSVLCADAHLGYSVPVGGVVAYEDYINVNGVGFDIACGNKAVLLDCDASHVKKEISSIMDDIYKTISFGIGRINNEKVDHPIFEKSIWSEIDLLKNLKDKAVSQLGTVGSGNHYIDIFLDEKNRIWIGVHFGSRGLGHSICTHFIKEAGGKDGIYAQPVLFQEKSDLGEGYLKCMQLAGEYAYAGRDWVCSKVASLLGAQIIKEVHNHHNFAWKENHFGKDMWVIRKGATPAFPHQKGFVGGSMGDISVILEGKESEISQDALYSTIHGAGRKLGRNEAKGKIHRKTGELLQEGKIKREDHERWIKERKIEVRGGDLDESPLAYKRIEKVLGFHQETINILHVLTPIGVAMASSSVRDPYKD